MNLPRRSRYPRVQDLPPICRFIPDCDLILVPGGCASCDFSCRFLGETICRQHPRSRLPN